MERYILIILSILLAFAIKATEVYICGYFYEEYECKLISDEEKTIITEPEIEVDHMIDRIIRLK